MSLKRRKEIRLVANRLPKASPTNQIGVVRKFIRSPNEGVAIAKLMGSRIADDLNGMLCAAKELVAIDKFDAVDEAVGQAQLDWYCAFSNIQSFVRSTNETPETYEVRTMLSDLSGIWRQAWLHATSSGDTGTRQYLTEWTEA
jgi:hypothetical protein